MDGFAKTVELNLLGTFNTVPSPSSLLIAHSMNFMNVLRLVKTEVVASSTLTVSPSISISSSAMWWTM